MTDTIESHFYQALYSPIAKTFFAVLLVVLLYTLFSFLARRIERKSMRERFKIRLAYVMTFLLLLLLVHIWLHGFGTIFAVVGFALAAFIVTNKESIMNFTGFLIIQWRELFTEGDHIQIGIFGGEVKRIGILYITLIEYLNASQKRASGRTIYVPNGLVITNQVMNYSQTSHFLAYSVQVVITIDSDLAAAVTLMKEVIENVLKKHYEHKSEYNKKYLERKDKRYVALIEFEPTVDIALRQEKPFGIQLKSFYYCYALDHEVIERAIYMALIPLFQKQKHIQLSNPL